MQQGKYPEFKMPDIYPASFNPAILLYPKQTSAQNKSCCPGWYIVLKSNLKKSPSLSWHLLDTVILQHAALENSC